MMQLKACCAACERGVLQGMEPAEPGLRVRPKLVVGAPGDAYEREADRMADQVMRMADPELAGSTGVAARSTTGSIQRPRPESKEEVRRQPMEEEEEELQMKHGPGATPEIGPHLQAQINGLEGSGRPLSLPARRFFEPRFGNDFSRVRVHTDERAARLACSVNARAFTVGRNVVFGRGEFAPGTSKGHELLAHELTHVIQQSGGSRRLASSPVTIQRGIGVGADLVAPRFSGNTILEEALDDERLVGVGSSGTHVRLLQESLLDMGYNLPEFGADGIFGAETKAAVERFQDDAGAAKIDGIVGPETMGLFDRHDTTNTGGPGPPATIGPLPGPRPAPEPGCDAPFAGVTFAVANATASGTSPAANIRIVLSGGRPFLFMQGVNSAVWQPEVTITAPDDPTAREFEVGFIQNLLTERVEYDYSTGAQVVSTVPTPIKDGAPLSTGAYHAVFVETGALNPRAREDFTANGDTRRLDWEDVPSDGAFINLLDNPQCTPPLASATMLTAAFIDSFRLWLAVRHRPSGCVLPLHHVDWDLNWQAVVAGGTTVTVASNVINVTVASGDGRPAFIQGGQVPGDLLATSRTCA